MPEIFITEITGEQKLISDRPGGRFGLFCLFGTSQWGFSNYGDEDIYVIFTGYGDSTFGIEKYSNLINFSGTYRKNHSYDRVFYEKVGYYIGKNPRTAPQQTQREKFADAVAGWQNLTENQKEVYNRKVKNLKMSGYNLYLKEYLLS